MEMENHKENLKRIFRIYPSIVVLKNGYINAKTVSNNSDILYKKNLC